MCLFRFEKTILKTQIIQENGLSDDEELTNLAIGDMMGGFEGGFHANMYNETKRTTVFLILYQDGSMGMKEVENGTLLYRKYIRYCQ